MNGVSDREKDKIRNINQAAFHLIYINFLKKHLQN